jgi:hypothetical protein
MFHRDILLSLKGSISGPTSPPAFFRNIKLSLFSLAVNPFGCYPLPAYRPGGSQNIYSPVCRRSFSCGFCGLSETTILLLHPVPANIIDGHPFSVYLCLKLLIMASTFQSSKKCPGCGKWSDWNKEITDTCQHCGVLLSDRTSFSAAAREAEQQKQKPFDIGIVTIHPHDSWPVVAVKRVVQAVQISFMAVVTFIIWFLTMLAG